MVTLCSVSVVGLAVLGGAIAAGISLLIGLAVAALVLVALINAARVLGALLEAIED